ncbi:MAG: response regulator transcription factor [Chloroflexi bacterium]|nr:response regulator transcription factor [Chloroflexota bacterium]
MIRVLIADDHHLFREGLARMLSDAPDITVVASVSNGMEVISRVAEFRPDVILMDVNMPKMDGVEATRQLRNIYPQVSVLMLTASEQENDLYAAIRAGARGYLLKSVSTLELIEAINLVYAKGAIITPIMAVKLLNEFAATSAPSETSGNETSTNVLSERENEVLKWVAQGLTNREIGLKLSLSPHTIKAHLRTILDKLHLHSRAEAAAWTARNSPKKNL